MIINIAICDDKEWEKQQLLDFIQCHAQKRGIKVQTKHYSSGKAYIDSWSKSCEPDILFLDIEMPEVSGIELKDYLQEHGSESKIMFVTSHEELVWEAFGKNVVGFLRKPLEWDIFETNMDKTMHLLERESRAFMVNERENRMVASHKMLAIRADGTYCSVHTPSEDIFTDKSITEMEEMLAQEDFFRVHKSYIINLRCIKRIGNEEVVLCDGTEIPIARRRKTDLKDAYTSYLLREVK